MNKTTLENKGKTYMCFCFNVQRLFLNGFQIDGTLKSGACGGPFLKIHRMYFVEQPAVFLPAKNKNTLKRSVKKMTKIT